MEIAPSDNKSVHVYALEHVDSEGSVVRSGMALAEAVLHALESGAPVEVDLKGIKGAASSYFNVFLRRIDEGCGLAVFKDRIRLRFASRVQELVYARSYESMKRGALESNATSNSSATPAGRSGIARLWAQVLGFFRRSL